MGGQHTLWDALGWAGGFRLRLLLLTPGSSQMAGAYGSSPALLAILELPAREAKSRSSGAPSPPPPYLGVASEFGS